MTKIFSVGEVTRGIKTTLEGAFPFVWVRGQVSNMSRPASGHIYFSLKDDDASLACVWFRNSQRGEEAFDPLTGEVFEDGPRPGLAATMQNGQELLCAGRVSVYAQRGAYQLVVELAQEVGLGELHLRFEELKKKLAALGWFDTARKRPLPRSPRKVAVVTAATGAAVRDFIRIADDRGSGCEIRIYPTPVQGDDAPPRIVEALRLAVEHDWAEVIVVIRGGGSLEDLWAFNDERVAKAIVESPLPVLAGIGHEVDTSIADMVADVRAATPSHAAQLLWPERTELAQRLDDAEADLHRAWERSVQGRERELALCERALHWLSPSRALERLDERFVDASDRLERGMRLLLDKKEQQLVTAVKAVGRSYSLAAMDTQVRAVHDLATRLERAGAAFTDKLESRFERELLRLEGADPLRPLQRGYSLVQQADGKFVRSLAEMEVGSSLRITVQDGSADVTVDALQPQNILDAVAPPAAQSGKKVRKRKAGE